jgi:hypothetical protein
MATDGQILTANATVSFPIVVGDRFDQKTARRMPRRGAGAANTGIIISGR